MDITIRTAKKHGTECIILCDTSHEFRRDGATTITVSKGADSVDFTLVNMLQKGDVVITQDYGLAAMCLARGAVPLSQDGMIYNSDNIEGLLLQRHTAKKIRSSVGGSVVIQNENRNRTWRLKQHWRKYCEENRHENTGDLLFLHRAYKENRGSARGKGIR